jgi:hypothetical protein
MDEEHRRVFLGRRDSMWYVNITIPRITPEIPPVHAQYPAFYIHHIRCELLFIISGSRVRSDGNMDTLRMKNLLTKYRSSLLVGILVLTLFVGPAAAQTGPPSEFEGIMTNLYDTVLLVLKYAGLVGLALGAIVWFTARKNSDRAENGMWLMIGGASMTIFYFGVTIFVSVLEWIASP